MRRGRSCSVVELCTAAIVFLSGLALFLLLPSLIRGSEFATERRFLTLHPGLFPRVTFALMTLLGGVYLLQVLRGQGAAPESTVSRDSMLRAGTALGLFVLYAALVPWLGFGTATFVTIFLSALSLGFGRWWQALIYGLTAAFCVRILFERVLLVALPQGRIPWLRALESGFLSLLDRLVSSIRL